MGKENEAKETIETFDEKADAVLDEMEKETPTDSSTEIKPEDATKTTESSGTDQNKTEQVKEIEEDSSLSAEDKIAKIKEILGDDEKAIDAYIREKGYHKDPAWQKQRELIDRLKQQGTLSEQDKAKQIEFEKVTNSREYIEASMRTQGFTQEAINNKLREKGFDVKDSKQESDLDIVTDKLGIDPKALKDYQKNDISDIAKIARVIAEEVVKANVSDSIKPIQQFINETSSKESGNILVDRMEKTVKDEGVLDWEKDVKPEINKYLDDNPNATQYDIFTHFQEFTRKANIERLKTGKRKEERDIKKENLRQNVKGGGKGNILPTKTGDFDKDADAVLDMLGVN